MPSPQTLFFALSGGVFPALLWLWFWLQEDRLHPEPRGMIVRAFLAGMIAVAFVLPLEQYVQNVVMDGTLIIIMWAAIEELMKYAGASFSALHSPEFNEPIDGLVYLITTALGFSAMENTLFLLSALSKGTWVTSLVTGDLRFVGATLLHVVSSAAIGYCIAISYYKRSVRVKELYRLYGVILAITLHALFNLFIMNSKGVETFIVLGFLWTTIVVLLVAFEKVKQLKTGVSRKL